jgi:hypothetical protein
MNTFTKWLVENKLAASLAAFFLLATGLLGWFVYSSWDDYASAQATYTATASKLAGISHRKPFPNEANLTSLTELLNREQSDFGKLNKTLQTYNILPFSNLDKVKPQDMPQLFQDALRNEVNRIKSLATASGTTLPPGFYLGLEQYENTLPQQEETISLARQLTVLSWMAEALTTQRGLILAEFSRGASSSPSKKDAKNSSTKPSPSPADMQVPYQSIGSMRVSFRCNQGSFREIINSISASPYFLLIEGIQLQNTSTEPPRRDVATQSPDSGRDGTNTVQRLPIVVGRESLNISLKIRTLEFQNSAVTETSHAASQPKSN